MASNAAVHKHNINRVFQFARRLFFAQIAEASATIPPPLQQYSPFLPILSSPLTTGVASPPEHLRSGGSELLGHCGCALITRLSNVSLGFEPIT